MDFLSSNYRNDIKMWLINKHTDTSNSGEKTKMHVDATINRCEDGPVILGNSLNDIVESANYWDSPRE